ncbi:MAG: hypothetical protein ACJAVV_000614 [Alphaproteobacteria bacterium]
MGKISQGNLIDKALEVVPDKNKVRIQGITLYGRLAKMISRSRADFAIMLPAEITYFENKSQSLDLLSYRIAGIEPISTVYMMCNKNKASKKFLETVDAAIRELYQTPELISANTCKVIAKEVPLVV